MLRHKVLLLVIVFTLLLAACGGEEPTPTPETAVTSDQEEPQEVKEETADDLAEITSEAIGVTVSHPQAWTAQTNEGSGDIEIASDAQLLTAAEYPVDGAVFTVTALDKEMFSLLGDEVDTEDPVSLLQVFIDLLASEGEDGEFVAKDAPAATKIAGHDGASATFDINSEELNGFALFAAVPVENRVVLALGMTPSEADYRPDFETMLQSLIFSEPVMAEAMPEIEEPVAESEPTAEAVEEVTEAEAPVVEEVAASAVPVFALHEDLPQPETETSWQMYSNSNIIYDVVYYDGILWTATDGGMVAWDAETGDMLRKWTTLDGLPHNVVDAITVCSLPEDRIVVGTKGGMSLYNPNTDTFQNFTPDNSGIHSNAGIDSFACVPQMNTIVIGYDLDGVEVYDAVNDSGTHYRPFEELESGFATAVDVKGNLDEIWVAHIGGVSMIGADGTATYYDDTNSTLDNVETDGFEHFVSSIKVAPDGTVWLGQSSGLTRVDGPDAFTYFNGGEIENWPFFSSVESMAFAPDGTLYTNTSFGGVCHFDPATETCIEGFEDAEGMVEDFNNTIVLDEAGNLYYGSEGEGISKYDGSSWQNWKIEELPQNNSYRALAQGADGSIWLGGYYGGQRLSAYDPDAAWASLDDHLYNETINTFYPTTNGMWVGHSSGASFYDFATGSWTDIERGEEAGEGIYKGEVKAIEFDNQGRMWFGTSGGVTVWDDETFTYFDLLTEQERTDDYSPHMVFDFLRDDSQMWVGASSAMIQFDASGEPVEVARFDEENSNLPWVPNIYGIVNDADGNMLVAADDMLLQFDGNDFSDMLEAESYITDIYIEEENGSIWLSLSGGGVMVYEDGEWISVKTVDGLPTNNIADSGVLIDYLGSLWVAGSEGGLAHFTP